MAVEKGITIKFRGVEDTSLKSAINKIRNEAKSLDKELGYVNKALKFDPTNVQLLEQKQKVLNQTVTETKSRLDELKDAQAQLIKQDVSNSSAEYRELEREIIKTESQLKQLEKEAKTFDNIKLQKAQAEFKAVGSKLEGVGESLRGLSMAAAGFDVALGGLAYKSGQAADDLNTLSKVTGISTAELQKYKATADLVDVSVETMAKSQTKMKKSMLSVQQGSKNMTEAFNTLGVSVLDSSGHLRNQDDVFTETIKALGQMENETERDALAMQIFGKSATELNPLIEDNGETYKRVAEIFAENGLEIVDQETIDKANQFQDSLDTIKATGMAALSSIGMQLAGYLAPAMEKISEVLGKVFGWLSQLDPEVLTIIGIIAGVIAVLSPVLIVVGKIAFAISSIISLVTTIGPVLAGLSGPIGIAIAIIGGLIALGVTLYQNWDTIKEYAGIVASWVVEKWTALKDGVVNAVTSLKEKVLFYWEALKLGISVIAEGIKTAITNPIQTAVNFIKNAVDKIKGFFSGLKIELPHIKLPHFNLTGSLSIVPPSVPKLSIDWYKNGGIFTNPTIFPSSGVGVGEAGAEAVLPLKKLWEEMDKRFTNGVTININAPQGMDVNELAKEVERRLITATKRERMVWG